MLLNGNHAAIARWRRDRSLELTYRRRPEMLESVELDKKDRKFLSELKAQDEAAQTLPTENGEAVDKLESGAAKA